MTTVTTRTIKQGDRGQDVQEIQVLLGIPADGIFGPATDNAVRAYQKAHRLDVDGVVGPATRGSLEAPRPLPSDALDTVARLVTFNGRGKYVLGAGGVNPGSPTPFTWRGAQYGSDCIGAVMWALGCPRHHDLFPEYQGDINTDSLLMDADLADLGGAGKKLFFAPLSGPMKPGVIVVYRSVWARDLWPGKEAEHGHKPTDMIRMGHVGLVVGWRGLKDPEQPAATPWDYQSTSLITAECCAAFPAVRVGPNQNFIDGSTVSGVHDPDFGVQFVEYRGPRHA